jgi:hypothetical protein
MKEVGPIKKATIIKFDPNFTSKNVIQFAPRENVGDTLPDEIKNDKVFSRMLNPCNEAYKRDEKTYYVRISPTQIDRHQRVAMPREFKDFIFSTVTVANAEGDRLSYTNDKGREITVTQLIKPSEESQQEAINRLVDKVHAGQLALEAEEKLKAAEEARRQEEAKRQKEKPAKKEPGRLATMLANVFSKKPKKTTSQNTKPEPEDAPEHIGNPEADIIGKMT